MKKLTIIFLSFLFVFLFACGNRNDNQPSTTQGNTKLETELTDITTENVQEAVVNKETAIASSTVAPSKSESDNEESPSEGVVFDITVMRACLEASKTMSDEDFEAFIRVNDRYASFCGFNTPQAYNEYIEDVSDIKLAVVDNNYNHVATADKFLNSDVVSQIVYMEDVDIHAEDFDRTKGRRFVINNNPLAFFKEDENTTFVKTMETENFTVDIFWSDLDIWKTYVGNIHCNGETYSFVAWEMSDLDVAEAELERLSFVSIRDLVN